MFWLLRVIPTAALCEFSHAVKLKAVQGRQGKEVIYVFICGIEFHTNIRTHTESSNHAHKDCSYTVIKMKY